MSTVSAPTLGEDDEVEDDYMDFVNSIRMSGDFGALVASGLFENFGAAASSILSSDAQAKSQPLADVLGEEHILNDDSSTSIAAKKASSDLSDDEDDNYDDDPTVDEGLVDFLAQSQQDVTGELVQSKLQNFELQQQLERLCRELGASNRKLETAKDAQREVLEKNLVLQENLEKLQTEKAKVEFREIRSRRTTALCGNESLTPKNLAWSCNSKS